MISISERLRLLSFSVCLIILWIHDGESEKKVIIALDSRRIQINTLNSSETVEIRTSGVPSGVTYDAERAEVYWSDHYGGDNGIYAAHMDGSGVRKVAPIQGEHAVQEISYDWIAENIYYAGNLRKYVGVCNREGKACASLVQEEHYVFGIAVDPKHGTMYWSTSQPAIRKAGMDGSSPVTIVNSFLGQHIRGVVLDQLDSRLYWANRGPQSIQSSNLSGGDRRMVIPLGSFDTFGIELLGSEVYWSEWDGKKVRRCNKVHCSEAATVISSSSNLRNLAIFRSDGQPKNRVNHCAGKLCSHICVLTPNDYFRCLCPQGLKMSVDGVTCTAQSAPSASYEEYSNEICHGKSKLENDTSPSSRVPISVHRCHDDRSLFQCRNGQDIAIERSCNGICDCKDGSDEGKGCNVPCNVPANASDIDCRVSPTGPVYTCAPGYRWSVEEASCVDVDECMEGHSCPHDCLNLNGSFVCTGPPECLARFDNETCEDQALQPQLIYALNSTMRIAPLNSSMYPRTGIPIPDPSGVDVNSWNGDIYWSSENGGKVSRITVSTGISRTGLNKVRSHKLISNLPRPTHLAYDWLSNNLYIVGSLRKSSSEPAGPPQKVIKLCSVPTNSTLRMCVDLYRSFGPNVTGLAVSPADNFIFWTEVLMDPGTAAVVGAVRRGRTDVVEILDLVSNDVGFPSGLAADPGSKRVFWLDAERLRVEAVDFDGQNRVIIVRTGVSSKARSLAVMGNNIMWSDEGKIVTCAMNSGTECFKTAVSKADGAVLMFKILHTSLQIAGVNPCLRTGCSHICTGARSRGQKISYKCYCPEGTRSQDFEQISCI